MYTSSWYVILGLSWISSVVVEKQQILELIMFVDGTLWNDYQPISVIGNSSHYCLYDTILWLLKKPYYEKIAKTGISITSKKYTGSTWEQRWVADSYFLVCPLMRYTRSKLRAIKLRKLTPVHTSSCHVMPAKYEQSCTLFNVSTFF